MGHELSSTIRYGVAQDAVLGIDVHDEQEHDFLGQLLNEVHKYRIPRMRRCRKGFQEAIQFMLWGITVLADDTRDAI